MGCVQLVMLLLKKEQNDLEMLSPRLINCVNCSDICVVISEIDCKIAQMAKDLYNNTIYSLNRNINGEVINDLLNYKRILQYRICNIDYGGRNFSDEQIISRIKLLIHK
jgi:hypothetical protein